MWNQQRLEQMISDGVEESLTLDYKASGAFAKQTQKREEIQKDVSAFANSAGGTIVYGIKEHSGHDRKHLPERLDPIPRDQFSKEWLEQIISGIQPRIQGVVIHPVQLDSSTNDCCYAVEIPQSETVHQAPDGKYYRRYNFENRFMQDYEVREAMNRSKHPQINVRVRLNFHPYGPNKTKFLIELENAGKKMALHYLCYIRLPLEVLGTGFRPTDPVVIDEDDELYSYRFTLPEIQDKPLFPGSRVIISKQLDLGGTWKHKDGTPFRSIESIQVTIYADEMEPVHKDFSMLSALEGWS